MSLAAAPGRVSRTAGNWREGPAAWPPGTRSWYAAAVSLIFAVNLLSSRYLWGDTYYDLYAGRYIVQHGIPHRNVVTVASHGALWVDQQWLAHVLYYGAWAVGGYPLVATLSALMVTSGFAVLALMMLRRGIPATRMFAWTLAAFAVCLGSTWIEAQSFAYLLFALTLWLILADDGAPRLRARTWLVIPVLVVWANTHGSVLLGSALVVLYAGYRAARALARGDSGELPACLGLAAAAAAAVLCTPYGTGVISYYARFAGNAMLANDAAQWAPPSPLSPLSWAFFALVVATITAMWVAWRRRTRPDPLLAALALILLALALTAVRNQPWFAFGASLLAADTLARANASGVSALSRAFRQGTAGTLAGLAALSLVVLAMTPVHTFESLVPVRALGVAAAAGRSPGVRVLGDDWSGTALLWLHPGIIGRVGYDARFEQYPARQLGAFFSFLEAQAPGWQRVLRGYRVVVVSRLEHPALARALARLPGWRVVYQDRAGLVLARQARP